MSTRRDQAPREDAASDRTETTVDALIDALLETRVLDREQARALDRALRARLAEATQGLSPIEVAAALTDWALHLAISPGKVAALTESLARKGLALGVLTLGTLQGKSADMSASDRSRMQGARWQRAPFSLLARGHALASSWADELTEEIEGVRPESQALVAFLARQAVELVSPANLPVTNPDVIAATVHERGRNLVRGFGHLLGDLRGRITGEVPAARPAHRVGRDIGVTPGKVIYQNALIELIQYSPTTATVGAQPVLIVPAWIMKYYILDLSPANSLIRYLVENGKTVFVISWKNPLAGDADRGMADYLQLGIMDGLDAVGAVCGPRKVHAVGYCLGGTLLTIAAARMARAGDDRLQTLTSLAAQIDFRDGGEIRVYLGHSMLSFVEALMQRQGFLDAQSMINAWTSLRVAELVYEPAVQRYLLGKERTLSDLLAWNVDGTRMPRRMHSEYLRHCYLNNDLAENRYRIDGQTVCVDDIDVPAFVLGTVTDHVAPWQSVYKALQLMHNEITFVLTTGGHNAGIVSGPDHPRRQYQLAVREPGTRYVDPDTWAQTTQTVDGSWWPAWNAWLDRHTEGHRKPPPMGNAKKGCGVLRDAPGEYVHG